MKEDHDPLELPASTADLRAFLRVESDEGLADLIRRAGEICEAFTGRALLVREIKQDMRASRAWARLGTSPVVAITGIEAVNASDFSVPLAAADYAIDIDAAGEGWVRLLIGIEPKRVRVVYRAGMAADPNGLPEALRHGIVRLAAHFHMHPGDDAEPPAAVTALWRPWRRLRLS